MLEISFWKICVVLVVAFIVLGSLLSFSNVLHNSALLAGFASYTIAVKRVGVLFGIVWGWLFFHEKNIGKKLIETKNGRKSQLPLLARSFHSKMNLLT